MKEMLVGGIMGDYEGLSDSEVLESVLAQHKPSKNPILRLFWVLLGLIAVGLAYIGIFLPGWPTVSWLVFAAFCFARSSQRLFRWLLENKLFGSHLLSYYRSGKALPLHVKIFVSGMIVIVSIASILTISRLGDPGYGQATIGLVAMIGIWFVGWKVPTTAL